jgi:Fe-S-cluster containining protein
MNPTVQSCNASPGHDLDDDGVHDPDECTACLLTKAKECICRCGECCRQLLIEVLAEDADREPKIKERGTPIFDDMNPTGEKVLVGYFLNDQEGSGCVFLAQQSNLCTIYETRPLVCRLFNCDEGEGFEQLVELGIKPSSA